MKRFACISCFILIINALSLTAQQVRFIRYGIKEGLSNESINCLFKDSRGFIWAGTDFGLNRFDGVKFETWFSIPGDSASMLSNKINTIAEDRNQQLWLGTDKGVSVYDMRKGTFKSYIQFSTDIGVITNLSQVKTFCDPDGDVWIGSSSGHIILFRQQTQRFQAVKVELRPSIRQQNEFISSFLVDSKGRIWAGSSYGIYRLNKNPLSLISYRFDLSEKNEVALNASTGLFETANGTILCGTWNGGYILLDEKQNRFVSLHNQKNIFLPNKDIFDFAQQDSLIYVASGGGLFSCTEREILNPDFTTFKPYRHNPLDIYSLSANYAGSLLSDTLGNLWIVSRGICVMNKNSMPYRFYDFQSYAAGPGHLPSGITQNGENLYLTVHDRLLTFNLKTQSFLPGQIDIRNIPRHYFQKYKNGYLLTSKAGVYFYDEKFRPVGLIKEMLPDGNPVNMWRAIGDKKGNIWIGTTRYGIRYYNAVTKQLTPYLHDTSRPVNNVGSYITCFLQTPNGTLYAGGKRLYVFNKAKNDFISLTGPETGISEIWNIKNETGTIWMGAREGLFTYNENTKKTKRILLPASVNQAIEDIEKDNQGNWWLVSPSGLIKYNPADSSTQVFNTKNGWPGYYSFIKKLDDGRMTAGCEDGIILFDPATIKKQGYSPRPEITQIVLDEKKTHWLPGSDTVFRMRYNQSIRFNFVSLNYENSSSNRYIWKLDGLSDEWHPAGNQTSQAFAALRPGKYVFHVKSANASGVWSDSSSITFKVIPPFYQTAWFIMLAAALVAAVVYAFYRFRLRQAIAMEKMRTKIATDLHDDIGATLSSISFYSEAVKQKIKNKLPEAEPILEKMGETSRSMVGDMSDIVWAINPKSDTAESLFKRMQAYAGELCQLKNVQLEFEHEGSIDKKMPDIEIRKNIYLIFKEAVNNALKYSDCKKLHIKVGSNQNNLLLTIRDDGCGFDPEKNNNGNGLANMKRRAAELKGKLEIHSSSGKGSLVELHCPLP